MDLYMPNCDGIELTALIRERDQFINTPVVFLSGEHDAEKRFDALSAGGDDYLEKPIRPKFLISAVTNRVRRARLLNRRVAQANPRDAVTGLYERGHVIERMANMLASENGTQLGGVLFVIIDGAQAIRERIGLSAFDSLLGQAGTLLAGLISGTDYAARYGDTSFLLMVQGQGKQALLKFGEEIRARFERHVFEIGDRSLTLAVSIGISMFAQGFREPGEMLNAAERACAQARTGTDQKVRLFETATLTGADAGEAALLAAIQDALRYDRFQLWYQPIASLHGAHDPQFQVLLRLRGDRGRLYTAAEILPVAAHHSLVPQLDAWVLDRVLAVLHERDRLDQPVRLFVSQDVGALSDPRRLDWLVQQLRQRQIGSGGLVIELRMTDIAARLREAAAFCNTARAAGVRICLNGFQAGAAASQLLQHVPVDFLKLDRRYAGATAAVADELRQLVSMAHDRGVKLITPLVEDAQSAAMLWSIGLDYIQGDFVQQAAQDLDFDFSASAI
jgi:diguanylate cyclase (GGDEF)-like protein